jgi:hypothetical protein
VRESGCVLRDVEVGQTISDSRYLAFDEDLYFSKTFFEAALQQCRSGGPTQRFALAENDFNQRFILPDSSRPEERLRFSLRHVNGGAAEERNEILPQKSYPYAERLPGQVVNGGQYAMHQCNMYAARIASPFHLLQVNMAANLNRSIGLRKRFPQWMMERFSPVNSRMFFRALRTLNRIGKGCLIHPTAIIEGSVIGDNVTIGANAIVRCSVVGAGSTIQDQATVMYSVLGKNNYICNGNHIHLCLAYDDVFLIHGPYQFSVFGKAASVFATINCDIRLDQKTIMIPTDVGLLDSQQPLLGVAYGHHSKVGGGNIIAAGRIVPNGRHILPPASIIMEFEE